MSGIIDRFLLFLCCLFLMTQAQIDRYCIFALLMLILLSSLGYYFDDKRVVSILVAFYCTVVIYVPCLFKGMPLIWYEITSCARVTNQKRGFGDKCCLGVAAAMVLTTVLRSINYLNVQDKKIICLLTIFAILLNIYSNRLTALKKKLIIERDNSKELTIVLKEKNHALIKKQDADIHLATLKERNRIAREIHDNVGHMLSRSILLTGAITAVNKDESLNTMLDGLQDTLNTAMTNIRTSVHDLHDESIDLKSAVEELLTPLEQCRVNYEYDMEAGVPREIKYCFISIVKEAITNIVNHSDADRVDVILMEHPSFYQLQVNDNGKCIHKGDGTGIGLANIKERVESFHGTLNINTDNGFRIFVNIPKKIREE